MDTNSCLTTKHDGKTDRKVGEHQKVTPQMQYSYVSLQRRPLCWNTRYTGRFLGDIFTLINWLVLLLTGIHDTPDTLSYFWPLRFNGTYLLIQTVCYIEAGHQHQQIRMQSSTWRELSALDTNSLLHRTLVRTQNWLSVPRHICVTENKQEGEMHKHYTWLNRCQG